MTKDSRARRRSSPDWSTAGRRSSATLRCSCRSRSCSGPPRPQAFEARRGRHRSYRRSLAGERRHLIEQFHYADVARKVVGVGSVGTRAWVVLMIGIDDEPLMLQLKEAGESVLAPFAGRSRYDNQGQRVVEGQQLLQASSDIFLGWTAGHGHDGVARDFYVRQLWDWKMSADRREEGAPTMAIYAQICGWTLARAHARSGDRVAHRRLPRQGRHLRPSR